MIIVTCIKRVFRLTLNISINKIMKNNNKVTKLSYWIKKFNISIRSSVISLRFINKRVKNNKSQSSLMFKIRVSWMLNWRVLKMISIILKINWIPYKKVIYNLKKDAPDLKISLYLKMLKFNNIKSFFLS
jgi:hypothetical protein